MTDIRMRVWRELGNTNALDEPDLSDAVSINVCHVLGDANIAD